MYMSVLQAFYEEIKDYLIVLISQGWIEKSHSSYASPVVCVRKNCGSLHLCINYRELNHKTHPIDSQYPESRISFMALVEKPCSHIIPEGCQAFLNFEMIFCCQIVTFILHTIIAWGFSKIWNLQCVGDIDVKERGLGAGWLTLISLPSPGCGPS